METRPVYDVDPEQLAASLAARIADLQDLATMGAVIASIHDIDAILSVVMDMSLRLVDGEVGAILLEKSGQLGIEISWGVQEGLIPKLPGGETAEELLPAGEAAPPGGMDLPTRVLASGQTVILNDLSLRDEDGRRIDAVICMPIGTRDRRYGVLLILNRAGGGGFNDEDRERLAMLLNFVAVAIDNARLMQEQLSRQRIEQEMAIARQVQETILPQDIDAVGGVEIGASYYPAQEVGGDFYDVHALSDNEFLVFIGDVSNKGVPAALVMSAAAGIIKSILDRSPEIAVNELASRLNEILAREIIRDREMFITLFFARFDLARGRMTYCNGGHVPGMFWSAREGTVARLSTGGPIVGQFPGAHFDLGSCPIGSGDRLFLCTDGLTEAVDKDGRIFGREQAEEVFAMEIGLPPKEFCVRIREWIDRFASGAPEDSHDDFTVLQVLVK
ncbi:MAG TPA: SpoIIE family protein phosphatase [candidate division Zixibacteria bacterium]|nr:SpoIIE family protein phosphatase [candidate division Zixibacteria bacterium]